MLFDIIGMIGVSMILMCYTLVQLEKIDVKAMAYSFFNALGAGLVLISLWIDFNLSAFIVEGFWVLISMVGIYKSFKRGGDETASK
ncbi:MAG: hypothetical protein HOH18_08945 [Kordiimonadaceae bacterium]|nr:hypothetical protein [Kordiimonadaceae bacterium]MBT6036586.1 hypothetical protein [Kordiimonadaceae bacterium]MBT7582447.1 hypothetical protein [Kordiimonadaceae bacterium]